MGFASWPIENPILELHATVPTMVQERQEKQGFARVTVDFDAELAGSLA